MKDREYVEKIVLNSIIDNDKNLEHMITNLQDKHFKNIAIKEIISIIRNLSFKGVDITYANLSSEIINNNQLFETLNDCVDNVSHTKNITDHVKKLIEFEVKDKLFELTRDLHKNVYTTDVIDSIVKIENELLSIRNNSNVDMNPIVDQNAAIRRTLDAMELAFKNKGRFFNTGIDVFDNKFGGGYPGELMIIGARPGMGKTTLLQHILTDSNEPCLVISYEMSVELLNNRLLAKISGLPLTYIKTGSIYGTKNQQTLIEAIEILNKKNIHYIDKAFTIQQLYSYVTQFLKENPKKIILLDYLQLVKTDSKLERRHQIDEIVNICLSIAKENKCLFVLLSQLSRETAHRANNRPVMSDLKESSGIEQAANHILLLHRDDYYEQDYTKHNNVFEIIVAKNRDGEQGVILYHFDGAKMTLTPIENVTEGF